MSILVSFFRFIKKPSSIDTQSYRWSQIIALWMSIYVIVIVIGLSIWSILGYFGVASEPDILQQFLYYDNIYIVILLAVILGPTIEELTFRLAHRYSLRNISIATTMLIYTLVAIVLGKNISAYIAYLNIDKLYIYMISIGLLGVVMLICRSIYIHMQDKLMYIWSRYTDMIILGSTLVFAIVHISNFADKNPYILLLVIPQLILGYMLSFIRMSRGIYGSIAMHALHNLISLVPILGMRRAIGPDRDTVIASMDGTNTLAYLTQYPMIARVGLYNMLFWLTISIVAIYQIYLVFVNKKPQ